MSRSDGTFPSYIKLDISAKNPVDGWNTGCRRCIQCGRNWPNVSHFSPSPCCNTNAGIVQTGDPDMSWPDAVMGLLGSRFEKYYEKFNEGVTDEQLLWLEPDNMAVSDDEIEEGMKDIDSLLDRVEGGISDGTKAR